MLRWRYRNSCLLDHDSYQAVQVRRHSLGSSFHLYRNSRSDLVLHERPQKPRNEVRFRSYRLPCRRRNSRCSRCYGRNGSCSVSQITERILKKRIPSGIRFFSCPNGARRFNILGNLGFQLFHPVEFHFRPEKFHELDFQLFAVDFKIEAE